MSPIANLFWNARERRLRAGWRLLVFLVMLLVVAVVEGRVRAGLVGRLPDLYEGLVWALVFAVLIAMLGGLGGGGGHLPERTACDQNGAAVFQVVVRVSDTKGSTRET